MKPGDLVRPCGLSYVNKQMIGLILYRLHHYASDHFMVLWNGAERLVEDARDIEVVSETG